MDALRIELDQSLTEEEWAARMPPDEHAAGLGPGGVGCLELTPEQA